MSQTDSFIEEVNDEVRRDQLFATFRKYGWIGVLVVALIVGGAAWREYTRANEQAAAQATGDAILAALSVDDAAARGTALAAIATTEPTGRAAVDFLRAAELTRAGQPAEAVALYDALAADGDLPEGWRQIAGFKAVLAGTTGGTLPVAERTTRLAGLAQSGGVMRLLAEEQLALIDVAGGDAAAALDRLGRIAADADASQGLRARASRMIVALGGTAPDIAATAPAN